MDGTLSAAKENCMGLLKKKKTAIEKAKINKTHEIICLYCFRNFNHNMVHFRAASAIDTADYRGMVDYPLEEYRARFNMPAMGELPGALNPDDFMESSKGYMRGILSSLRDKNNHIATQRLCPYCHNNISASAGFAPSIIISITGTRQAGKSVYLTSLIHTLKMYTSHNFDVFCSPISTEMGRKFKFEYEDPLLESGYLLEQTQRQGPQEPFIFTFSFTDGKKPEINIVFFDIAGESMIDGVYAEMYADYIRNSSGLMFLVDPRQFRALAPRFQNFNQMVYDLGISMEPTEVLANLVENYVYKQPNGISPIPTAVALTKTDLLEVISYDSDYIRPRSNVFDQYIHREHLNLTETDIISYEIDEFIQRVDPNFRNALRRRFANMGLFGVSALGSPPEMIRKGGAEFTPIRVDEPFLWILNKLGYIEGFYEGARL